MFPAGALFLAVAAFNLFGEGLYSLLTQVGFGISRLLNRYTIAGTGALALFVSWLSGAVEPVSTYKNLSDEFDVLRTTEVIETLAGPAAPSRGIGTDGLWEAALYLAQHLDEIGLQPAGKAGFSRRLSLLYIGAIWVQTEWNLWKKCMCWIAFSHATRLCGRRCCLWRHWKSMVLIKSQMSLFKKML